MSYATAEGYISTLLKATTGLSSATVTQGDYGVLDKGITAAAVIYPGALEFPEQSGTMAETSYTINVDFFVRFGTQSLTHSAFVALRDAIIAKLKTFRRGNLTTNADGFFVGAITANGDPQDIQMANTPQTGPVFRAQTLSVRVVEYDLT